LLKGRGIPTKSRPQRIALVAVTFAVPAVVAIVMLSSYLSTGIAISVKERAIANFEAGIGRLAGATSSQKSLEEKRNVINGCLSEVSTSIGRHAQWSPVLLTLVENMPDLVVLTGLEVTQDFIEKKVPKKDNPEETTKVSIPVRKLQMSVSSNTRYGCDEAVWAFRDRLRSSTALGPRLQDILIARKENKLRDRSVVSYEIDCVFKPGL